MTSEPRSHRDLWEGLLGEDADGPFWVGARCASCHALALGARDLCPVCWSRNTMVRSPAGRTGRVYSCTIVHQSADGFETPMIVGYVDIEEGLRVFAHLESAVGTSLIGAEVALSTARLRRAADGAWLIGPRYRPL